MADLMNIFGPIAKWNEGLRDIQAVAIDVIGTAIDRHGDAQKNIIDLAFHLNRTYVDIAVSFVSTDPMTAWNALLKAGVKGEVLKNGVMLKEEFYDHAAEAGEKVLSLDDEAAQAVRAAIHIDPKDEEVGAYLRKKPYRRKHVPQPPEA